MHILNFAQDYCKQKQKLLFKYTTFQFSIYTIADAIVHISFLTIGIFRSVGKLI